VDEMDQGGGRLIGRIPSLAAFAINRDICIHFLVDVIGMACRGNAQI